MHLKLKFISSMLNQENTNSLPRKGVDNSLPSEFQQFNSFLNYQIFKRVSLLGHKNSSQENNVHIPKS